MLEQLKKDAEKRMTKSIESFKLDLTKLRTGRAQPSLLDHVVVSYYGNETPLNQVANVSVADSRTLSIQPWEKSMIEPIEKAIMNSDLGLNPVTAGQIIRVPLPPLTEERRREMIKVVKQEAENTKVAIRNIRRDANNACKDALKNKQITEDDVRRSEEVIQKLTDKYVKDVETIFAAKEAELMEV